MATRGRRGGRRAAAALAALLTLAPLVSPALAISQTAPHRSEPDRSGFGRPPDGVTAFDALPTGPDRPGVTTRVSAWNPSIRTTLTEPGKKGGSSLRVASMAGLDFGTSIAVSARGDLYRITDTGGSNTIYVQPDLVTDYRDGAAVVSPAGLNSLSPVISADGEWIAYSSHSTLITAGDPSERADIFLYDRERAVTTRISSGQITVSGSAQPFPATMDSITPSISADGAIVVYTIVTPATTPASVGRASPGSPSALGSSAGFSSRAPEQTLTEFGSIILVYDRLSATTTAVAIGANPAISGNGQYIAFETSAQLAKQDTNTFSDVYRLDRFTGQLEYVSVATNERPGNRASGDPAISENGTRVAFSSGATNFSAADTDLGLDIYVRNIPATTTTLVSTRSVAAPSPPTGTTAPPTFTSASPSISDDGQLVVFWSTSPRLVAGDTNRQVDVFVRDLRNPRPSRVSLGRGGREANGGSLFPVVSGNGRFVAFISLATNLVPSDTNGDGRTTGIDVFLFDRSTRQTTRVSIKTNAGQAAGSKVAADLIRGIPGVSRDGRYVVYQSNAPDLVGGDGNFSTDIFLRDRTPVLQVSPKSLAFGSARLGVTSRPQTLRVTNGGSGPLAIGSTQMGGAFVGDYLVDNNTCIGKVLYPEDSCSVGVRFRPTAPGDRPAVFTVTERGGASRRNVAISGAGIQPLPGASVAPAGLTFGPSVLGTFSAPQLLTLTNTGSGPLEGIGLTLSGPASTDFTLEDDACTGQTLAPKASCTVQVRFRPLLPGDRQGLVGVASSAAQQPQVLLTGIGIEPKVTISPTVGPGGTVVIVAGTGFPPAEPVIITWQPGISPPLGPVAADTSGTFQLPVLVYDHDVSGLRELVVQLRIPGVAEIRIPFLVVTDTAQPRRAFFPFVILGGYGLMTVLRR